MPVVGQRRGESGQSGYAVVARNRKAAVRVPFCPTGSHLCMQHTAPPHLRPTATSSLSLSVPRSSMRSFAACMLLLLRSVLAMAPATAGTAAAAAPRHALLRARSRATAIVAAAATTAAESDSINDEAHMRFLIDLAMRVNPAKPFAAAIVDPAANKVLCTGVNDGGINPVFHGEIAAITNCTKMYGWNYTSWLNYTLYTTAESCPMCQSAIEWARLGRMVFGTSIGFLESSGWSQIDITAAEVNNRTRFHQVDVVGGVLEAECNKLFAPGPPVGFESHAHGSHNHAHDASPL